ncbi:MAG: tetratricopeptide repeat protein [Lachnospiraceae bacterium]|nr:tetratricopeptide repeat protein [Lachnospiraceae bacterium]MBR0434949.1 tetratricopeptide repeat protein [Lachnospiraceae bacterium]
MNTKKRLLIILAVFAALLLTACTLPNPREKDELSYRSAGIKQLNKGDYKDALTAFQKALDNSNGRISAVELDICYYKAFCLINLGRNDEAMEVYDSIIAYDKKEAKAHLLKGHLYAALNEIDKARKEYDTALSYNGGDYAYYLAAYENLIYVGANDDAESYLKKGLDLKGKSTSDYVYQGRFYLLLKDYDAAKLVLSEAINEGSGEARLYMAEVLREMGQEDQAYGIYENYIKNNKNDPNALYRMVQILMNSGEYEKALTYVDEAIAVSDADNEKKELLEDKILAYEKLNMYKEAMTAVKEYIKIYPDDAALKKELVFLSSRVSD